MTTRKYTKGMGLIANMRNIGYAIRQDIDAVFLVTGREGSGKSNLALWLAQKVHEPFNDVERFKISQVVFTPDQFFDAVGKLPKYSALVVDEGVEIAYNRDAMKTDNKKVTKALFQIRQKNLVIFFLIPDRSAIDKTISKHRALAWLHVNQRGKVSCHKARKSMYQTDIYWDLVFVDSFPKVSESLWNKYLESKHKAFEKIEGIEQNGKEITVDHRRTLNADMRNRGMTQKARAEALGVSDRTVRTYDTQDRNRNSEAVT